MKKIILSILSSLVTLANYAQVEVNSVTERSGDDTLINTSEELISEENFIDKPTAAIECKNEIENIDMEDEKSLDIAMPIMDMHRRQWLFSTWMPTSPFNWGNIWDLHEGLNAQIGAGVMVGFGKYNPFKGTSFFTDVSMAYAKQLDSHWSVALGGTLSHFKMWNKNEWAGDLFGIANYKFDEHWSASIYASYNHMPHGIGMYGLYAPFDMMYFNQNFARIGGEVTYHFNNNCSISVGISSDITVGGQRPWLPQRPTNTQDNSRGR